MGEIKNDNPVEGMGDASLSQRSLSGKSKWILISSIGVGVISGVTLDYLLADLPFASKAFKATLDKNVILNLTTKELIEFGAGIGVGAGLAHLNLTTIARILRP